jgi:hypothetical protein
MKFVLVEKALKYFFMSLTLILQFSFCRIDLKSSRYKFLG